MPGRYTKLYLYCSKWLKGQFICRWCFGHTTWPRLKLTCCDGIFGNLWQGGACSLWTLAAESDQFKWTFSPNYYIFSQHHLQKYPKNNVETGIKTSHDSFGIIRNQRWNSLPFSCLRGTGVGPFLYLIDYYSSAQLQPLVCWCDRLYETRRNNIELSTAVKPLQMVYVAVLIRKQRHLVSG